jgi:hypothetical protein
MTALFYQEGGGGGGGWTPKTSLTPPHLIEMPVTSQDSEQSCICVLWVSIVPLSVIFLLGFSTISITITGNCCTHAIG